MGADLSNLTPDEMSLLEKRFAGGESLAAAAARLGISRLEARQRENEALRKALDGKKKKATRR